MIAYIRLGLILAALGLSAWGGWAARSWLDDSRELKKVAAERDEAIKRERAADRRAREAETSRAKIAGELETEKGRIHAETAPIIKRVPVYIGGSDCALDVDGVRNLNAARGAGSVPNARRLVDDGPRESRADSP